jgi:hypothetical protein
MAALTIPSAVRSWLHDVFRGCNERITAKLCNQPNAPEQTFDLTWIEYLSQFASPVVLGEWIAKIETHYLGGLRQFYGWEVADIGVLLFVKLGGVVSRKKVALLQSKRLYPTNMRVTEETRADYEIGLARLADAEDLDQSISAPTEFKFTHNSKYGAIVPGSKQVAMIETYQTENKLKVYYQLYNPWHVPFTQRLPLTQYAAPVDDLKLGVRIVPAASVHKILGGNKASRPRLKELDGAEGVPMNWGWPLEVFISDQLLDCREGDAFGSVNDARIQNLFYRRTGPISAAVAITIEGPATVA